MSNDLESFDLSMWVGGLILIAGVLAAVIFL